MGGSSSSPSPSSSPPTRPTPLPPSPPVKTMITVCIIDIDGRKAEKDINLEWVFSLWAKSLVNDYEVTGKNLSLKFNGLEITYNGNESKKLKTFGFSSRSDIYISHEQKGCSTISLIINDTFTGLLKTVQAKIYWTFKEFCEELERNHGIYGIISLQKDTVVRGRYISFGPSKNKTLRELEVKNLNEVYIVEHIQGGR
ncbi:unnamed protein product [Blepharisma stoltei]|uniref:Uncharacterized protein n=1 Tax=Blepharisma stoltei TaxID=1481888 RepID=A0AAU9IDL9_9CILI|nr:unnamed protein product [Blepharisma stoltei]